MSSNRERYTKRILTPEQYKILAEIRKELGGIQEAPRQDVQNVWRRLYPPDAYARGWLVFNAYYLRPDETGGGSTVLLDPAIVPETPFPPKRNRRNT